MSINVNVIQDRPVPISGRQWFWLFVVWIPFPCLFLPVMVVTEGGSPWYLVCAHFIRIVAVEFNRIPGVLTILACALYDLGPQMPVFYLAALIQSCLLSGLVLRRKLPKWGS